MAEYKLFPERIQLLVLGVNSPVVREMSRVAERITNQAKVNLTSGPNAAVDTGRLRASGRWRLTEKTAQGLTMVVEFPVSYAIIIHEGRGPVRPVKAKALRYRGAGGAVVFSLYSKPVAARPFLTTAARSVLGSNFTQARL